ncbi:hypothetical protein FNM00_14555 [Aeromicrobium piscarium]|uniref:Neutral/alkaline non-lysosomal ceramidase N-terminal domain-containing protein n=1 Tax=Aeromicrobium piscarium TaxID=2590901 RepID=A0A554RWH9_9ACTN|nr:hypothetical protein FNM00_14555 [Aeromicrobium piscarium]
MGIARRDITPPVGIRARNWGAALSDVSTGVHAPLTATALALGDGDRPAYLVSLDLGWWASAEDERALRDIVLDRLGAGEERLLIHLIHTHAGPSVRTDETDLPGGELIPDYIAALAEHIVDACEEAARARVPGLVTWAYGRCDLAVNRDLPCGDGTVVAFNPGTPADDTLLVGRITDENDRVLGTLLNYACHPTTLAWDNTLLSPDLVAGAREIVEAETGAPCLFVQGASGDLGPRYGFTGDPEDADRNGHALGHAASAALTLMPPPGTGLELTRVVESGAPVGVWEHHPADGIGGLRCERIEVSMPLAGRVAEQDADLPEHVAQERARRAARLRRGYVDGDRARHPVWVWHLGPAVLVAHPGEAYSALQTELRRRHVDRPVVVANLTNGPGHVYLPTREAYERDRYQVWQSVLAAGCLERLIEAADEHIVETAAGSEDA